MYWLRVAYVDGWYAEEEITDTELEERWKAERDARTKLIKQVTHLANLPHPPRRSWSRRLQRQLSQRAKKLARRPAAASKQPAIPAEDPAAADPPTPVPPVSGCEQRPAQHPHTHRIAP
jgi:hypothetical protein